MSLIVVSPDQIGRILPNLIGDFWGPFNAIIVCTMCCTVLIFAMLGATDAAGIIAISVLYGLFSGACTSSPTFTPSIPNGYFRRCLSYQPLACKSGQGRLRSRVSS